MVLNNESHHIFVKSQSNSQILPLNLEPFKETLLGEKMGGSTNHFNIPITLTKVSCPSRRNNLIILYMYACLHEIGFFSQTL